MINNILRNLYNGKIIPWERRNPHSEKQLEILREAEAEEKYLAGKMASDDSQRFQALIKRYSELSSIEEENVFSYGFTLGLLLALGVADEAETLFSDRQKQ